MDNGMRSGFNYANMYVTSMLYFERFITVPCLIHLKHACQLEFKINSVNTELYDQVEVLLH